jgi:hypothetical protein
MMCTGEEFDGCETILVKVIGVLRFWAIRDRLAC